jgi:hypothetical protein
MSISDPLNALDVRSWGVLEVKLLEKRLKASDQTRRQGKGGPEVYQLGTELKQMQRECAGHPVDAIRVAMTMMRYAEDTRVVLYALVMLEGALAESWMSMISETDRRALKEQLKRVYDNVAVLDPPRDREAWLARVGRAQRLVEERRQALGDQEAHVYTKPELRGPNTTQARIHLRSSESLPALKFARRIPNPGPRPRRLEPIGAYGKQLDVPVKEWWRARCLEHFPGRPRPMLKTSASATFFGGSGFTVLDPADRLRSEACQRCQASTF